MNAVLKPELTVERELHPLCTLFPRLSGAEFDALRDDIKANGLRSPIVLHDGMILDGGNRYRACIEAGVAPRFAKFDGSNLVSFVLSANLHRRHMSAGQQAAIVASAQDWAKAQVSGSNQHAAKSEAGSATLHHLDSAKSRAAESGASLRTQKMADKVAKKSPALAKRVAHGEISLPNAHKQVSDALPKILPRPEAKRKPEPIEVARDHAKKQNAVIRRLRADIATRDAEIEALKGDLAEVRDNAAELADSLQAYMKAEEGVEVAAKEIKRLTAQIRVIEATRDQYMTQNAEMKRSLAAKDRKIAKLEGKP